MTALRPLAACVLFALPFAAGCQPAQADTSPEPMTRPASAALSATAQSSASPLPAAPPEASPAPLPRSLRISAVGDCTLGGPFESEGAPGSFTHELASRGDDYRYPFAKVLSVLAADDLTIANLEVVLAKGGHAQSRPFSLRGKPEFANVLSAGSVELVNVANNHSYDFGPKAYDDTVAAVRAAGVGVSGNEHVDTRVIKGIEVVNIGFTGGNMKARAKMTALIAEHKRPDNLLFVSFHWGVEGVNAPTTVQLKLGHAAIDAGADLVIGTHPHVLQGIETYRGKHIVYSLGNFVFGGNGNPADKDSIIYQETFTEKDGRFVPSEQTILPVRISGETRRNDYQPVLLEGAERERVLARLAGFNAALTR
jgi:poly-gamma-glutamate capsule biosynthesis protein CapA/YwtB (metallophosphatase superfamily)